MTQTNFNASAILAQTLLRGLAIKYGPSLFTILQEPAREHKYILKTFAANLAIAPITGDPERDAAPILMREYWHKPVEVALVELCRAAYGAACANAMELGLVKFITASKDFHL